MEKMNPSHDPERPKFHLPHFLTIELILAALALLNAVLAVCGGTTWWAAASYWMLVFTSYMKEDKQMKHDCSTCRFWFEFLAVCCNGDSEYCADVNFDGCDAWEKEEETDASNV